MRFSLLVVIVVISKTTLYSQTLHLFVVPVQNKFGFIDSSGRMVIGPLFRNAGEFAEGLAAVRENGRYGYIDASGRYVLPPAYDFANKFEGGIAKVFIDGAPVFINHQGRQVLPAGTTRMKFANGHIAVFTTNARRMGMVDLNTYALIADTAYGSIGDFSDGVAVVKQYLKKDSKKYPKQAVIDTAGRRIVPFGIYDDIGDFSEGCARVRKGKYPGQYGLIDTKGNEIYLRKSPRVYAPGQKYYNGRAAFCSYQPWDFGEDEKKFAHDPMFSGYIDRRGNIVFRDTGISKMDFSDGRVFIERESDQYYIYDTAFREIGTMNYSRVLHGGFYNGLAIVRDNAYWGIIDTSGRSVVPFRYNRIEDILGNYFIYSCGNGQEEKLYGINSLSNEMVVPVVLQHYDSRGFVSGLLHGMIDGRQVYINQKGKTIWQQDTAATRGMQPMNIDYMTRGYCYAYQSARGAGTGHYSGGDPFRNLPIALPDSLTSFPNTLHLFIDTVRLDTFGHGSPGYRLMLVNHTNDTVVLQAQDNRLYINLQALDKNSVWRDIEYLPSSWCGNSYHTLALPGCSYWSFTIPRYEGEIQTMIRVKLNLDGQWVRKSRAKPRVIYSYPIRGSVNPGQLWNKRGYQPVNFMDPYFE